MPKEEKWVKNLRELYLTTMPDEDGMYSSSILFNWAKFEIDQIEEKIEFYLLPKESLEEYIEQVLKEKEKQILEEILNALPKEEECHCETCVNDGRCPEWQERNQVIKKIREIINKS